jgi:hypothetical protein
MSDEQFISQLQSAFNDKMHAFSLPELIATEGTNLFNRITNREGKKVAISSLYLCN